MTEIYDIHLHSIIYIYMLSLSLSLPLSMIVSRVYFFDVEVLTSAMWLEEGVVFLVGVVNQLARHATLGAAQKKGNDLGGFSMVCAIIMPSFRLA